MDMPPRCADVCFREQSGRDLLNARFSAFDPKRTRALYGMKARIQARAERYSEPSIRGALLKMRGNVPSMPISVLVIEPEPQDAVGDFRAQIDLDRNGVCRHGARGETAPIEIDLAQIHEEKFDLAAPIPKEALLGVDADRISNFRSAGRRNR